MGAIRKRGTAAKPPLGPHLAATAAIPAPLVAQDAETVAAIGLVATTAARAGAAVAGALIDRLLVVLEDDRRDNARHHERAAAKRENTDAAAHLSVVRYIERLKERLLAGEV